MLWNTCTRNMQHLWGEESKHVLMCFTHAVSAHRYERLLAIYIVTSVILRFGNYLNVVYFYVLLSNWEYAQQAWLKQLKIIKFRWVLSKKKISKSSHNMFYHWWYSTPEKEAVNCSGKHSIWRKILTALPIGPCYLAMSCWC